MGNQSSNLDVRSLHENWVTAIQPTSTVFSNINLYRTRLLVNTVTLDYIQQYNLHFTSEQQFKQYCFETQWRQGLQHRDPLAYIPPIRAFINTSTTQLCARSYNASIYFDKIQMRLQEINDIPFNDNMYMMRICLEGFKLLTEHFGVFKISEDMVFINRDGSVKVWINGDLSSIQPWKGNKEQLINVRRVNSNNFSNGSNNRESIRQGSSKFSNPSTPTYVVANKFQPSQLRTAKVSNNISLNRRIQQQLAYHSKTQHPHQNSQLDYQLSQQNMIKDILKIMEDNIDMQSIKQKIDNTSKFKLFSQFIKQYYTTINANTFLPKNGNYLISNQPRITNQLTQPLTPTKPYINTKYIYKFDNILQLYNKYIQHYSINVPRKMQVIQDIFRSKYQQLQQQFPNKDKSSHQSNQLDNQDKLSGGQQSIPIEIQSNIENPAQNKLSTSITTKKQKQSLPLLNTLDQNTNHDKYKDMNASLKIAQLKNNQQHLHNTYTYHTSRINQQNHPRNYNIEGQSLKNIMYKQPYNYNFHNRFCHANVNFINNANNNDNSNSFKYRQSKNYKKKRLATQGSDQTNNFNIISNNNTTNMQLQTPPQVVNQQKVQIVSLNNTKIMPTPHMSINILNNNHDSPYSHGNFRLNSVQDKSSTFKYNITNTINNSSNIIPNNQQQTIHNQANFDKYYNPLSILLDQQNEANSNQQQHRIIRTNHIQTTNNPLNLNQANTNLSIRTDQPHLNQYMHSTITNMIPLQPPQIQPIKKARNSNQLVIIHQQKKIKPKQPQYPNYIDKLNSTKVLSNSNDNNKNDHTMNVSLNKGLKIDKQLITSNNNYFSQSTTNTIKQKTIIKTNWNNDDKFTKINKNNQIRNTYHATTNNNNVTNKLTKNHIAKPNSANANTNNVISSKISTNQNKPTNLLSNTQKNSLKPQSTSTQHPHNTIIPTLPQKHKKLLRQAKQKQIKYYTSNDSYQLDSQIADDLQHVCPQHK